MNPFTISQTAITISYKNIGRFRISCKEEKAEVEPNSCKKPVARCNAIAMKPQTAIQGGMSLERITFLSCIELVFSFGFIIPFLNELAERCFKCRGCLAGIFIKRGIITIYSV